MCEEMEGSPSSSIGTHDSDWSPSDRYTKKPNPPNVDYISSLSDTLLIHVLSLLPTTKDAIKTGVLSRRWLYLWTHLSTLVFNLETWQSKPGKALILPYRVDRTLIFISSPKVKRFKLVLEDFRFEILPKLGPRIDVWIRFAVLRHVEELFLELKPGPWFPISSGYLLPRFFYVNPCLSQLKTEYCCFVPSGKVEWMSLRVLEISYSTLSNETMGKIISGSPLLESLKLCKCLGIRDLDITSKRLKSLVVDGLQLDLERREYSAFVITAPFLENLEILGGSYFKWKVRKASSLMRASLDFFVMEGGELGPEDEEIGYQEICVNVVFELLNDVRHAKELKCGHWFLQVVSALEKRYMPVPLLNCNLLVLKMPYVDKWIIPGMASLFRCSLKNEKLMIEFSWDNNERFKIDQNLCNLDFGENYWQGYVGVYAFSHLKITEIFGLSATPCEQGRLYEFIEFLLKNAQVLQKMIIRRDYGWTTEDVLIMVEKLLSFPRSSPDAVIIHHQLGLQHAFISESEIYR